MPSVATRSISQLVILLLAGSLTLNSGLAVAAPTAVIQLERAGDITTWPLTEYRNRDLAQNAYAPSYQDAYGYETATVTVTFTESGAATFTGHISAVDLKPNFAYQLKLAGMPTGLFGGDGDDATNERLGYAGRWWEVVPNPGNRNDAYYETHRDDPDYIFEGYLVFDFLLTDRFGAAELDFALDSSYHVLWWDWQRNQGPCDEPLRSTTVTGAATDFAYNEDLTPTGVSVYPEIERLCYGETTLTGGEVYNCRFVLTEESFHQSGGPATPDWVGRSGLRLQKDGGDYYYAGTNCYYLMTLAADPAQRPAVDEVLNESKTMGLNGVRTWAFSDGGTGALQISPGVYDENIFVGLDYVVTKAGELGLQLILPLVNNWDDYGGMNQYVAWNDAGPPLDHDDFYTDPDCRQWYRDHASAIVNRVNTFTGVIYKDDPTIMAWELANEPRCESDPSGDTLQGWIEEMAAFLKSIDAQHLVTTGSEGFFGPGGGHTDLNPQSWMSNAGVDFVRNHAPAEIDLVCLHIWPDQWGLNWQAAMDWISDHVAVSTSEIGKPVILEEFGKNATQRDLFYQGWYDEIYSAAADGTAAAGSHFWILYHDGHSDDDGYGIYYPADGSTVAIITAEARRIRDLSTPVPTEGTWAAAMTYDELQFTLAGEDDPPGPVTDLNSEPSHERVTVTWTSPGDPDLASFDVFRGLWHDGSGSSAYPFYGRLAGSEIPNRPASKQEAIDSEEWVLVASVESEIEMFVDQVELRSIYFYEVFAVDADGNASPPAADNGRATNYWLGDIAPPGGDGYINILDINALGLTYGISSEHPAFNPEADIGPTDDSSATGMPLPDGYIQFEDLIIFGIQFGGAGPDKTTAIREQVVALSWSQVSECAWSCHLLEPCNSLKGLHLVGELPAGVSVSVVTGELISQQAGPVFLRNAGQKGLDIGMVSLGRGVGIEGTGELFRIELTDAVDLRATKFKARNIDNAEFEIELTIDEGATLPDRFQLAQNYPNPFNPSTTIAFDLPEPQVVSLTVYSLDGRKIVRMVSESLSAGQHEAVWTGCDESGRPVAAGTYIYRLQAGSHTDTKRMLLLK